MNKRPWQSKTFWAGLLQLAVGLVELIFQPIGNQEAGGAFVASGVSTIAARLTRSNVKLRK